MKSLKVYVIHKRTCDVIAIDVDKIPIGKYYYILEHDAMIAAERKRKRIISDLEDELDQLMLIDCERDERKELINYYKNLKIRTIDAGPQPNQEAKQ
jgi:hypothetical protein